MPWMQLNSVSSYNKSALQHACPLNGPQPKEMKHFKYPSNNSLRQLPKIKIKKIQRHPHSNPQSHWLCLFFFDTFKCQFSEENLAKKYKAFPFLRTSLAKKALFIYLFIYLLIYFHPEAQAHLYIFVYIFINGTIIPLSLLSIYTGCFFGIIQKILTSSQRDP